MRVASKWVKYYNAEYGLLSNFEEPHLLHQCCTSQRTSIFYIMALTNKEKY